MVSIVHPFLVVPVSAPSMARIGILGKRGSGGEVFEGVLRACIGLGEGLGPRRATDYFYRLSNPRALRQLLMRSPRPYQKRTRAGSIPRLTSVRPSAPNT